METRKALEFCVSFGEQVTTVPFNQTLIGLGYGIEIRKVWSRIGYNIQETIRL